jgi:hypothetical protein
MQDLLDADKSLDEIPSSQKRALAKPLEYTREHPNPGTRRL